MNDESSMPKDFFDVIAYRHAESGQAGWSDDDYGEDGTEAVDKDQMYVMSLGLRYDSVKLPDNISQKFKKLGIWAEAKNVRFKAEELGVKSVDFHDKFLFL